MSLNNVPFENYHNFFTLEQVANDHRDIFGNYSSNYSNVIQCFFELLDADEIYQVQHNDEEFYITKDSFAQLLRNQNLETLLGLRE